MKKQIDFKILVLGTIILALFAMTSCRSGYGCHGTSSWGGMVRKANRFN